MDKAVGLKYVSDLPAPFVVSKGKNYLAEKIYEYAKENDIPVMNEPDLAESLFDLNAGDFITEDFYEIVAGIFAFLQKIQKKMS